MTEHEVSKLAAKCFKRNAEDYYVGLIERHQHATEGTDHHPSEKLMLAYLMCAVDGYNEVELCSGKWEHRSKKDFGTTLGYQIGVAQTKATFLFECRCQGHVRELAVLIDTSEPNVRTVQKQRAETALASVCSSVMLFTADEVLSDPEACKERVEAQLNDVMEEAMVEAGVINGPAAAHLKR
jgi:hypothetical protein